MQQQISQRLQQSSQKQQDLLQNLSRSSLYRCTPWAGPGWLHT